MPEISKKKTEINEQFYQLLKEMLETQSIIIEKLDKIIDSSNGAEKNSPKINWKDL